MEEKTSECQCPVDLKPMEDWIQELDPNNCRPCLLAPVTQWYAEELQEQGRQDLVNRISEIGESVDIEDEKAVLTLCKELDIIKSEVEEPLRGRLKEFDCHAQSFDPYAAIEEAPACKNISLKEDASGQD